MRISRRQMFAAVGLSLLVTPGVATGVAAAALDGQVHVGEWERYYLGLDSGAHQKALSALGIAHRDGVRADDPFALVSLADLARAAVDHRDHAAADCLRAHFGWDTPSMLRQGLQLVLGEDGLEERYLRDPQLQLRVIGHFPKFAGQTLTLPDTVVQRIQRA